MQITVKLCLRYKLLINNLNFLNSVLKTDTDLKSDFDSLF